MARSGCTFLLSEENSIRVRLDGEALPRCGPVWHESCKFLLRTQTRIRREHLSFTDVLERVPNGRFATKTQRRPRHRDRTPIHPTPHRFPTPQNPKSFSPICGTQIIFHQQNNTAGPPTCSTKSPRPSPSPNTTLPTNNAPSPNNNRPKT